MPSYKIAVIPGDGIGKEVVPEGVRVLEAVGQQFDIAFQWEPGFHLFPGAGLSDLAGMSDPDEHLVGLRRFLALDAVKERGHAVVIILRPPFERMVVTLRALQAGTEEDLRNRLDTIVGVGRGSIKVGRRI